MSREAAPGETGGRSCEPGGRSCESGGQSADTERLISPPLIPTRLFVVMFRGAALSEAERAAEMTKVSVYW